ncbi:MAG: hypothetical protein CL912_23510 [Deltaproteobacteria bacterium]|nr:hypothetical protein [Deltaproteobacteria bacterium]
MLVRMNATANAGRATGSVPAERTCFETKNIPVPIGVFFLLFLERFLFGRLSSMSSQRGSKDAAQYVIVEK